MITFIGHFKNWMTSIRVLACVDQNSVRKASEVNSEAFFILNKGRYPQYKLSLFFLVKSVLPSILMSRVLQRDKGSELFVYWNY